MLSSWKARRVDASGGGGGGGWCGGVGGIGGGDGGEWMDDVGAAVSGHERDIPGTISTKILQKVVKVKREIHVGIRVYISVIVDSCSGRGVECDTLSTLTEGVLQAGSMSVHNHKNPFSSQVK